MAERIWSEDMGEISGFGGGYEAACRAMVFAGMDWVDAHPDADPVFQGYTNVFGVICEINEEAEALTKVVVDAAKALGGSTGAMHQATIGHVLAYRRLGWEQYCRQLRDRDKTEERAQPQEG